MTAALVLGCLAVPAAGQVDVAVGDLPAGESLTIEIVVTVAAPVPAGLEALSTQGSVTGDNFATLATDDPDGGGGADPTLTLVSAAPELGIAKTYSGPQPLPGDTLPFDLSFANDGDQGATGVTLGETVPANTTFNAGASTGSWSCADGSPAGTPCELAVGPVVGGGGGATAVFAVDLDDPLPPGTVEVLNTATVADDGANGVDPDPSDNSDTESIALDMDPPTVVGLDTLPPTPDGGLDECEAVTVGLTRILVGFSEPMRDPPGDADPDDVTNPDNYLLVSAGPDLTYDTSTCGGLAGDDVAVPLAGVGYDSGSDTAALTLPGILADGLYRLLVCGSTTLRDATGNPLDGDGNGTGGDDFLLSFRGDRGNLFGNGHLDCGPDGWTVVSTGGAEQAHDPLVDAAGSPESGSQMASVPGGGGSATAALGQCVPLGEGRLDLTGSARLQASSFSGIELVLDCAYHAQAECGGAPIGSEGHAIALVDTAGAFLPVEAGLTVPAGTASSLCTFTWASPTGTPFDGWLDALTGRATLFADGFESGDTSAWSVTVP